MATVSLDATLRSTTGKGSARKDRAAGRVPAVVYSSGQAATPVSIDPEAIEFAFKRTQDRNTLVELNVPGQGVRPCLIREAQRHPVSRQLLHVDFYQVGDAQSCTIEVRVVPVGTAVGTKLGGKLQLIRRDLRLQCKASDIPSAVEVDVTKLQIGAFIKATAVVMPPGCTLISTGDFNVVTVTGKRGAAEEEAEAAAGGEA